MERVLTSSQRKISPMPTGPKDSEKRPADVLGKRRRFKPFHVEGRFNEVRPERAKTQSPALTSRGVIAAAFLPRAFGRGPL